MRKIFFVLALFCLSAGNLVAAQSDSPQITHGPLSGEVTADTAVLWARGSAAGTLTFEAANNPDFSGDVITAAVEIDETSDFTGEARLTGLAAGRLYTYRVTLTVGPDVSDPVLGSFRTAPASDAAAAMSFVFSACVGGQGYCRPPETGWTIFDKMLAEKPDFFIHMGDSIYADSACLSDEGKNVPGAEGPYTDLAGFRTRYRYHLEDPHYAELLSQTPVYVTWDDHEIVDNFSGVTLNKLNPRLFAEGRQAYFEYWPLTGTDNTPYQMYRQVAYGANADLFVLDTRSYRDPIVDWDPSPVTLKPKTMLGTEQLSWLKESLSASTATWKFIVTSVPLAYPTGWPQPQVDGRDGWANGADASGYETELTNLLFYIETHDIENVIFLSGDVHWPFAISYDPDSDGTPNFYEFGSSPMSAIPLAPPPQLDLTFNPTVLYAEGEYMGTLFNFGQVSVTEAGELTFRILDREGVEHYALTLSPQ